MSKFTFKEHEPTGRYRSFYHSYWDIKLKKRVCGTIHYKEEFTITFMVNKEKSKEDPCNFRNARLKKTFKTIEETKAFLIENTDAIIKHFDLYFSDD
jgi:hypothetical protein